MAETNKLGIILAPYGTLSPAAYATYEAIVEDYEKEFPLHPVRLAFTSRLMKKRLEDKEGISVPGLLGALQEMQDLGCRGAVVQSLQILPGKEFHQTAELARSLRSGRGPGIPRLELGLPLLSDLADCRAVSSVLPDLIRRAGVDISLEGEGHESREAVLLAGHGTGHPSDALYCLLATILEKECRNVFLGSIEGAFGLEELLPDLKRSGAERVLLMPFLLVAGGHAEKDLFGEDEKSWKSILEREGYAVLSHYRGLVESAEIRSIFLDHTRSALQMIAEP